MVENRRLGRLRRAGVVMAGDGVEQLDAGGWIECGVVLLDQPCSKMDVAEESPLRGLAEPGSGR